MCSMGDFATMLKGLDDLFASNKEVMKALVWRDQLV